MPFHRDDEFWNLPNVVSDALTVPAIMNIPEPCEERKSYDRPTIHMIEILECFKCYNSIDFSYMNIDVNLVN